MRLKVIFEPKRLLKISDVNAGIAKGTTFIENCENDYEARISGCVDRIIANGCEIIMVSGPSASGKTTSSYKLAYELKKRGRDATVVSLDNFFRNMTDYPRTEDGKPDLEHLLALDIESINRCLKDLVDNGQADIPTYDFKTHRRSDETIHLTATGNDYVIIEGIHALNPVLSTSIPSDSILRVYAGLRTEYTQDDLRVVVTRDIRITRRLLRDFYFRAHSVRDTLELWERLQDGEERWIKPFKVDADILLDTSFVYEPGLYLPILAELCEDECCGGEYRGTLLRLLSGFGYFSAVCEQDVPLRSMLREFIGGLELS